MYVLMPADKAEEMNKLLWLTGNLRELPTTAKIHNVRGGGVTAPSAATGNIIF